MKVLKNVEQLVPVLGKIKKRANVAVLSGAGMSAESGISTFRDSGGLWEQYSIYDVATPEAWQRNPELVQRFYNERRRQLLEVQPNPAHCALARLKEYYNVDIITQNIDDLHERAGSEKVLHLHGELRKCRSSVNENLMYEVEGWELQMGQTCPEGSQLRPHVVWFGEAVPNIEPAAEIINEADLLLVIGTSLEVYPAAGLVTAVKEETPILLIDPASMALPASHRLYHLQKTAGEGVKQVVDVLIGRT